jgi:hypothetical protein
LNNTDASGNDITSVTKSVAEPSDRVGNFSLKEDELIATFLVSLVIVKIKEKGKECHGR